MERVEKDFIIRTYECDKNNNLRIITLMNIFQDAADEHAEKLGVGLGHCIKNGVAWVGTNYHIKINRLPKLHEKINIITWPCEENKLTARRDFKVVNDDGEVLITAASLWALIDINRKRPLILRDNLPAYNRIDEKSFETDFSKIADLASIDFETEFKIRFDDIDINNHVNNAVYPLWATEAVDGDFRLKHTPIELEISFKKEAFFGDWVKVATETSGLTTTHSIKSKLNERELAKIRIIWKQIINL